MNAWCSSREHYSRAFLHWVMGAEERYRRRFIASIGAFFVQKFSNFGEMANIFVELN
jgi:hypothetical protein